MPKLSRFIVPYYSRYRGALANVGQPTSRNIHGNRFCNGIIILSMLSNNNLSPFDQKGATKRTIRKLINRRGECFAFVPRIGQIKHYCLLLYLVRWLYLLCQAAKEEKRKKVKRTRDQCADFFRNEQSHWFWKNRHFRSPPPISRSALLFFFLAEDWGTNLNYITLLFDRLFVRHQMGSDLLFHSFIVVNVFEENCS